jgi:hypothetical protein
MWHGLSASITLGSLYSTALFTLAEATEATSVSRTLDKQALAETQMMTTCHLKE